MSALRAARVGDHARHGILFEGRDGAGNESTGRDVAGDGEEDYVVAGGGDIGHQRPAHAAVSGALRGRGYNGLFDRRRGKPSSRRVPVATVEKYALTSIVSTFALARWVRLLLKSLGPGVITGAADPSGIATYSVAGAQLGTKLLWTALLTWPLMAAVQMMCARLGMVTGQGLAGNFKRRFPSWLLKLKFLVGVVDSITMSAPVPERGQNVFYALVWCLGRKCSIR